MAAAPTRRAAPSAVCTFFSAEALFPISCSRKVPKKAIGTEPNTIHPTRARFTVRLRRWTAAPNGRISTAATRSLEMAVEGLTPNSRMSMGVINAPPPAPVIPTKKPTTALPRTMKGSICTVTSGHGHVT